MADQTTPAASPTTPPNLYTPRGGPSTFEAGKYDIGSYSYPADLYSNTGQYGGNYAIFYINVSQDSKLITSGGAATVANLTPRDQGDIVGSNIANHLATANATAGINTMLGDIEALDQVMAVYSNVAVQPVAKSFDEINARIEKLKAAPQDHRSAIYGDRYSSVETSVVSQEAINTAKDKVKELKRQRQAMQDKLLSLNVNTLITIKPEDETLLTQEGII